MIIKLAAFLFLSFLSDSEASLHVSSASSIYNSELVYKSINEEKPRLSSVSMVAGVLSKVSARDSAIFLTGLRSGRKSATTQLVYLALKNPALALGISPA